MERRNYTRQPLRLRTTLILPSMDVAHATITDFCPGGLFLVADATDTSIGQLETNDTVQIQIAGTPGASAARFKLRARVAGAFNGGVGFEFFDPDVNAVKALQAAAAAFGQDETPVPRPITEAARPSAASLALIAEIRQRFSTFLHEQTTALFKKAEEALFVAARDAENNVEQNAFFDTMKDVEQLRGPIDKHFVKILATHLDHLGSPMDALREPDEGADSASELSLVESGEFADWLAAKNIYSRNEQKHVDALFKLDARLSELAGVTVDEDNNPLGLAALCHTFHDAVQSITTPRVARRFIFEAFDDSVIAELDGFYAELNTLLENQGILPGLERPLPSVATTAEQETAQDNASPTQAIQQDTTESTAEEHVPSSSAPPAAAGPAGVLGSGYENGSVVSTPATQAPFSSAQAARANSQAQPPPLSRQSSVQSAHQEVSPGVADTGAAVPAPQQHGEELGGEAYPELSPHPSLEGGRPFNPTAAAHGHVYSNPMDVTLSAFSTAQALLSLGRQLDSNVNTVNDHTAAYDDEQVNGAISLLQSQESSLPLGSASSADLNTRLTRALRSRHGYADKKAVSESHRNAVDMIEQLVSSIVEDPLVAAQVKPHIQRLEVPLLNAAMRDQSFFAEAEHPARQVLNQLGRITGGHTGALEPSVDRAVSTAVEHIVTESADDLGAYARATKQLDRVIADQAATRRENLASVIASCESEQSLLKERGAVQAQPSTDPQWREWIDRARRLQVGDTVVLNQDTAEAQRAALAWVGEDHATCVFVDDQGLKASTVSLQELAVQLRHGTTDVVAETELTAMDRGLYGMLRKMHDQVLSRNDEAADNTPLNRRDFEARLEQAVTSAQQGTVRHSLYLLDMDHFTVINDTCGRKAGDRLLREIGRLLRKTLRAGGIVARLEEDKFAVLLEDTSQDQGFELADKQRAALAKFKVTWKGERLRTSASIGLTEVTTTTQNASAALTAASQARARAKADGGNRIEVFRGASDESDAQTADWIAHIDATLNEQRLELRCQKIAPIDDTDTKPHYEILLGLRNVEGNAMLPGEFVQAAELYGRAIEVDRWVIENTFNWMAANKRQLLRVGGFSINVSAKSLSDEATLPFVLEQFTSSRLPPGKVLFEVTETAAIQSLSNAENFIRVLKEYGCRFLLDDFGTGHSSYSYLKHLPIDYVKIDGLFVKDIVANENDEAMVKSINEVGHFMGKKTVAEFVENKEILERLREIGVDYAQGFAIERPRLLSELA